MVARPGDGGVTLGALLTSGDRVTAYCRADGTRHVPPCTHGSELDVAAVTRQLGEDVGLFDPALQSRLVCRHCGSRGATFICSPAPWALSAGGRAGHASN